MEQNKIWDHFQNEGLKHGAFNEARPRNIARQLRRDQTVLNIGVGSGVLEALALAKGVNIHVLDPNERAITRLRFQLNLGEQAKVGFAQELPFGDSQFDVVVMSEVLEHLADDKLSASLVEVWRVLKPGGVLWVSTPYREDLNMVMVVCPKCGELFHRFGHVQSFDRARLSGILNDTGYVIEKLYVTTFVDWRRSGLRNFVKSLVKLWLAKLGESIADPHLIALARRPIAGKA
jgi:SAM-dependent methyltransferase